ncbi:MAG: calcium/sodium antiporter [Burkholderiaceae bacterium]
MIQTLWFALGLIALVAGADALVRGASKLAFKFGISPLVVGLTVVAFGTSAPELAVSVGAVLSGTADLAIGNVVGSNIFNVLFILGVAALIVPLAVDGQVLRQEAPIMIGSAVLLVLLAQDGSIGGFDGAVLTTLMVAYTVFLIRQSRSQSREAASQALAAHGPPGGHVVAVPAADAQTWKEATWFHVACVLIGLVLLVVGAQAIVGAAVFFARALGVSDTVIGLTVVAAGTSLPEVATSVRAAMRGERDIAVGNVVGSCVFNVLGVLGISAVVASMTPLGELIVPTALLRLDLWVMLAASAACLPVFLSGREIARWEGVLFLALYGTYTAYLILLAQHHDALAPFSATMAGFVLPLVVVTLLASSIGRRTQPS